MTYREFTTLVENVVACHMKKNPLPDQDRPISHEDVEIIFSTDTGTGREALAKISGDCNCYFFVRHFDDYGDVFVEIYQKT